MSIIFKLSIVFVFLFVQLFTLTAQTELADKITLKTGEVYVGYIQVKNSDILLIKSLEGGRFQFPISDIKLIEKVDLSTYKQNAEMSDEDFIRENKVIFGLVEISGAAFTAKNKFNIAPGGQLSLTFGAKLLEQKTIFTGIGIGLTSLLNTKSAETYSFLPLFLTLKTKLADKSNTPFFQLRAGYSFALSNEMKGGLYSRLTAGWSRKINENTAFQYGLHADIQTFSGNLTESNQNGNYNYYGNSDLLNFGLNAGIEF